MTADAVVAPNVKQAVPFFMVTDIKASLHFYVDGLGFAVTNEWRPEKAMGRIQWCRLQLGNAAVMLQEYWRDGRPGGAPEGPLGQGVSVCVGCGRDSHLPRSYCAGSLRETPVCWKWSVGYVDAGSGWLISWISKARRMCQKRPSIPANDRVYFNNTYLKRQGLSTSCSFLNAPVSRSRSSARRLYQLNSDVLALYLMLFNTVYLVTQFATRRICDKR
jgi:hypothetical protein